MGRVQREGGTDEGCFDGSLVEERARVVVVYLEVLSFLLFEGDGEG